MLQQWVDNWRRCVFFSSRRRHTRYWRDWSSDVCSSDLIAQIIEEQTEIRDAALEAVRPGGVVVWSTCTLNPAENEELLQAGETKTLWPHEIGRAAGRGKG